MHLSGRAEPLHGGWDKFHVIGDEVVSTYQLAQPETRRLGVNTFPGLHDQSCQVSPSGEFALVLNRSTAQWDLYGRFGLKAQGFDRAQLRDTEEGLTVLVTGVGLLDAPSGTIAIHRIAFEEE